MRKLLWKWEDGYRKSAFEIKFRDMKVLREKNYNYTK